MAFFCGDVVAYDYVERPRPPLECAGGVFTVEEVRAAFGFDDPVRQQGPEPEPPLPFLEAPYFEHGKRWEDYPPRPFVNPEPRMLCEVVAAPVWYAVRYLVCLLTFGLKNPFEEERWRKFTIRSTGPK